MARVSLRYADSGRPAVGLIVDQFRQGSLVDSATSDGTGRVGNYDSGVVLKLRRGRYSFKSQIVVSDSQGDIVFGIPLGDWPIELALLKQAMTRTANYDMMQLAAQRTVDSFAAADWSDKLLRSMQQDAADPDRKDPDNPLILIGALTAAMGISTRYLEDSIANAPLTASIESMLADSRAIRSVLVRFLSRIESLQGDVRGYIRRWRANPPEQILEDSDFLGDPSLDEYGGLLLGFAWLRDMTLPIATSNSAWGLKTKQRVTRILTYVRDYLRAHDGFLVRPQTLSFVARGSYLGFFYGAGGHSRWGHHLRKSTGLWQRRGSSDGIHPERVRRPQG